MKAHYKYEDICIFQSIFDVLAFLTLFDYIVHNIIILYSKNISVSGLTSVIWWEKNNVKNLKNLPVIVLSITNIGYNHNMPVLEIGYYPIRGKAQVPRLIM